LVILHNIQNIKMNYFQLFGLPIGFKVDAQKLRAAFMNLQKASHPDKFSQATEEEQILALENSANANKGFSLLNNAEKILPYVLEIKGYLIADEKYALSPNFLMEMMELNEAWMDANTQPEKDYVLAQVNKIKNEISTPIQDFLEADSVDTIPEEGMLQIKDFYYKKKYLDRILADFR
jgi:molecular chaperone HscB